MTQLPTGPPLAPRTVLDDEGIKRIEDRLTLVTDTRGYDDEMAAAIKSTMLALVTQDLPALLDRVKNPDCPDCESIHRVHHLGREEEPEQYEPTRYLPYVEDESGF